MKINIANPTTGLQKVGLHAILDEYSTLLNQKAKAMVVVSSRREAVRWKLAIDNYINKKKYPLGTLVAFSGEVKDKVSGPDPFTEKSK